MMAAQASGRQCVYSAADRHALLWYAAGQVLGAAYSDERYVLTRFHHEADDALRRIIPSNSRLDSPAAPIVFLERAEREGWIVPTDRRGDIPVLQTILMFQPASVLDGLAEWDGSLDDFLEQPFVDLSRPLQGMSEAEREQGSRAFFAIGGDALECTQLVEAPVDWFETDLFRVFRDWLDNNSDLERAVQTCGSTVRAARSGYALDLEYQVRDSLLGGIAACIDGDADYVTLSSTTRDVARRLQRSVSAPRQLLRDAAPVERAIARISSSASVDALTFVVANADTVRLLDELFAPAGDRETVGGFVDGFAQKLLPSPIQFLHGISRLALRRRRRR